MDFGYDPRKSSTNKQKHGIDFEEAQRLWLDANLLVTEARSKTEPRFLTIGRIEGRFWTAVITYRGDAVRLISVRRSRNEEVRLYESIND